MIRFLFRGCLWVYTAWFAGFALSALMLDNTSDVIAHGARAGVGLLALAASHLARAQRQRIHGGGS